MASNVAIDGGAAFLRTRLSKRFNDVGAKYVIYDVKGNSTAGTVNTVDIEDINDLDHLAGAGVIINLAAVHRDDVRPLSRYDDVNVQDSVNVCAARRKHGTNKIVFTLSVAIYGFAPLCTDETGYLSLNN